MLKTPAPGRGLCGCGSVSLRDTSLTGVRRVTVKDIASAGARQRFVRLRMEFH